MSRLLLLVAIAIVIYLLVKSFRQRLGSKNAPDKAAQDMVRCSYCGTHLPQAECVVHADKYYCTEAHKRAHLDQPE